MEDTNIFGLLEKKGIITKKIPKEGKGYAKIEGEVVDVSGNVLTNYNGILTATIYDKNIDRATLARAM